jgi:hypothetical protein
VVPSARVGFQKSATATDVDLVRFVRCLLGLITMLVRRDLSKDAELLVLRHENTVLRRQVVRLHYTPADRARLAALSQLVPRLRWAGILPPASIELQHDPPGHPKIPVGFQKSAAYAEQQLYAVRSYSLIKPPRIGRRVIRSSWRSATAWVGRGG